MGLLSSVHESRTWTGPYSLKDPALSQLWGGSTRTSSGLFVSDDAAMMYSAIYAAVNRLSSDVAKLPLNLMKARKTGGADHYTESKTYKLLKFRPNPEMSDLSFRQALTAHALTLGGGYAEIERNALGRPVNLWPITPNRICQKRDEKTGRLYYLVDQTTKLQPMNVLHIHGLGFDGTTGYALLHYARQAVGLAMAAEQFAASFFKNGTQPGGVISLDGSRDPEELKEYRAAIEAIHGGSDKAFRFLLLDNGAKFQAYPGTNQDAQMDELRDKQIEEVARFYNMPAHKLGNLKHATFSNIEQQDLEYYKGPVTDWISIWEKECTAKLVPELEQGLQYFKHNANAFLRGDIATRYTALGIARDKGIINADEWRDLEDMNPQDGEQGKEYLVQSAQIPARMLAPLAQSQIDANKAKAEPPHAPPAPTDNGAAAAERARAERAEAAVAELRADLEQRALATAEAKGIAQAQADELARRVESERLAQARVEAVTVERDAAGADRDATSAKLATAEAALADAMRDTEDAKQQHAKAEAAVADLTKREAEVREQFHNLSVIESALRTEHMVLESARASLLAQVTTETEARVAAERTVADLTARAETAEAHVATALAEFQVAKDDAEAARQLAADATAQATTATTDKAAAEAMATEARALLEQAQARVSEADQRLGAATAELAQAEHRIAEAKAETERAKVRAEEIRSTRNTDADGRTIAAHRHLFVHVMRGAIERETDRARRAQQTPEKLRHWIDTWYDGHAELMRAALLPAVQVHLAWLGDDADAYELSAQLVAEHIATSRRQLAAVVNGDADALAGSLAGLLRRWETERVNEIPDRLMEREVAHVRSSQ